MGTIGDFREQLPDMANNALKNQLLNKLDAELRKKMYACGGDIEVDLQNGNYTVTAGGEKLEQAIMADLRIKK